MNGRFGASQLIGRRILVEGSRHKLRQDGYKRVGSKRWRSRFGGARIRVTVSDGIQFSKRVALCLSYVLPATSPYAPSGLASCAADARERIVEPASG